MPTKSQSVRMISESPTRRRPWQAVALLISIALTADAEIIQKWKTREGQLYFGDKPPAGSTKIGEEGAKDEPAAESPVPEAAAVDPETSAEQNRLSIEMSRQRKLIETALNRDAERYAEVSKQIADAERLPDLVEPWMEKSLGFANEKGDMLRRLRPERREIASAMLKSWERFDQLDAQVRKSYGSAPDWWRKPSCAGCPSRSELRSVAQSAAK